MRARRVGASRAVVAAVAGVAVVAALLGGVVGGRSRSDVARRDPRPGPVAAAYLRAACALPPAWAEYVHRGWDPGRARAWDLAAVPRSGNWFGSFTTTSHSGP